MTYSTQYNFGVGNLVGVRTDQSVPTPAMFGTIQEASVDIAFTQKELYGQNQFPVAVARGPAKVTGKAKFASINSAMYNSLFFNDLLSTTSGIILFASNEAHSVPGVSTYTVTVTQAATFSQDYGVLYAATGQPLTRVASVVAAGTYSVNTATGVYTFYSGDAGAALLFNYAYTATTGGSSTTLSNQLSGAAPTFKIIFAQSYQSNVLNLTLNACISTKLNFPFKNQDFTIQDFEFSAFVDSAGNWGNLTTTD
jgi:hypothetical protein